MWYSFGMVKKKTTKKPTSKTSVLGNLKKWNVVLAFLHAVQGVLILALSREVTLPVTTNYLTTDTLGSEAAGYNVWTPAIRLLADVNLAYLLAVLFFIAAIGHIIFATSYRKKYEADLAVGMNRARWVEYVLGGGLLLVTVALINGVSDLSTLVAIFALAEVLALFSLLLESHKELGDKHPRVINKMALVLALTPWIVTAIYLFGAQAYGNQSLPTYIYWVDGIVFATFMATGLNMLFNKQKKGRWTDYFYTERVYMLLGLAAKSALAWLVFFGTLR